MFFNQSHFAEPFQSLIYGVCFTDAALPCNRLSRRKCNACAAVAVLAEATVDGDVARSEIVRENVVVYSEIGIFHVISFMLYYDNASFLCATSKSQKTDFGVFYDFKMVSPHCKDIVRF